MKHLILLSVFISLNTFSASDTCPPFQNLIDLNDNFELSIKSRKEVKGSINLEVGKSKIYDSALMTISTHSQNLSIPKGAEVPLMFVSSSFYNQGDSSKDQDRSVSGVLLVENKIERLDFTINDRSQNIPTVQDLETALGDSFSISCKRKEISSQDSAKSKSTSVSNQ